MFTTGSFYCILSCVKAVFPPQPDVNFRLFHFQTDSAPKTKPNQKHHHVSASVRKLKFPFSIKTSAVSPTTAPYPLGLVPRRRWRGESAPLPEADGKWQERGGHCDTNRAFIKMRAELWGSNEPPREGSDASSSLVLFSSCCCFHLHPSSPAMWAASCNCDRVTSLYSNISLWACEAAEVE